MRSTGVSDLYDEPAAGVTGEEIVDETSAEEVTEAVEEVAVVEEEAVEEEEAVVEEEAVEEEEFDPNAELKAEVAELEAKVKAARQRTWNAEEKAAKSGKIGYMRLAAEFESYRVKVQQDKKDEKSRVEVDVLRRMIDVVDDLRAAPVVIPATTEAEESIHKSYQTLYTQLEDRFKKFGLETFEAVAGEKYNPLLHEAVSYVVVESEEEVAGTIKSQVREGSRTSKAVIRKVEVEVFEEKVLDVVSEDAEEVGEVVSEDAEEMEDVVSEEERIVDETEAV
eukprot:CAMPEP_0185767038 /NCGR_PEP_ID=MMETSP1174-20130828/41000_1 /TAXON_ID=35687 /ORGANISM="Dictyocha speculum, Strain CCMP1381" /LENGTH=279 /DNA_ID=CAMNT_0028451017 /DNA_START=219 /DNA_END=1058 /DNA_ORIENTATION=-